MQETVRSTMTCGACRTIGVRWAALLLLLGTGIALQASDPQYGDIFVGVGNGQFQVWHNTTGTTYASRATTISDGTANNTAGCAIDSTYHPFTTNTTNGVYRHKIFDQSAFLPAISAPGATSIAFDGHGNYYVGTGTDIVKFGPDGTNLGSLGIGGGTWVDLSSLGNTVYFTNGSDNNIYQFSVPCGEGCNVTTFASIPATPPGSNVTLHALRVLTPAAQSATSSLTGGPGLLLVAAVFTPGDDGPTSSNIQLLNSAGISIKTYSVDDLPPETETEEDDFEVVTLDPNGTSFWAGSPSTHNFYRFNLATGAVEVGPLNTGVEAGPTGLCAYGAFNAAQPQPITKTATLNPANPGTSTFDAFIVPSDAPIVELAPPVPFVCQTPPASAVCNEFTYNLFNLTDTVNVTFQYTTIDPNAGASDPPGNKPCQKSSLDGTQCEVYFLSLNDTSGVDPTTILPTPPFSDQGLSIFSKQPSVNPAFFDDLSINATTFVFHDETRTGGRCTQPPCNTVYTLQDQSKTTGGAPIGTSCGGYILPRPNTKLIRGIPALFVFKAATSQANCTAGHFLTGQSVPPLVPRLALIEADNYFFGPIKNLDPDEGVPPGQPIYDPVLNTWAILIDTSKLQAGGTQYYASTTDDSGQIAAFSEIVKVCNLFDPSPACH